MKKLIYLFAFGLLLGTGTNVSGQNEADSTGFIGDNFSLEGAMDLFKNAASIEDFEKQLNAEDNYVNNLDLNEDGKTDYIRVEDQMKDELHAIILQVYVDKNEIQDIAVIEIEKTGKEEATAQIIGDEEIYGSAKIVEPFEVEPGESDESGPDVNSEMVRIIINVWLWPSVRYVYAPVYRPWVSPWHWGVYPTWWSPWRPHPWRHYHARRAHYSRHYRVTPHHRVVRAHNIYKPRRRTSVRVTKRTTIVRTKRKSAPVVTRKKTTTVGVKKQNGKVAVGKKTTTTTRVNKGNKTVTKKKTTAVGAKKGNGKVTTGKKTTRSKTVNSGIKSAKVKRTKTTKVTRSKNTKTVKKTKTTKVRRKR